MLKTSEIEGEKLKPDSVRSSVARRLGVDIGALAPTDRHVDGMVDRVLDATQNHETPLTPERLFSWHAAMFPTGYSGLSTIRVGQWRDDSQGPMQVVSGPVHRQKVHYESPPAQQLDAEMTNFLHWFNADQQDDPVIKAGLAHLWLVTIHLPMAMDVSPARLVTWHCRAPQHPHNATSASPRKSKSSAMPITTISRPRKKERWMSPTGWRGSSPAC